MRRIKGLGIFLAVLLAVSLPDPVMAADQSAALDPDDITITNNAAGTKDTVAVTGLAAGTILRVYASPTGATMLGTTVSAGKDETVVSITQLGTDEGNVYVSVAGKGQTESLRTEKKYDGEQKSKAPEAADITVNNNVGTRDTVRVKNLEPGDIIKVYATPKGAAVLGTGKADNDGVAVANLSQLGNTSESVYVTVTTKGLLESDRTERLYGKEEQTGMPDADSITIENNAGAKDTITVSGLEPGDTVKVYATLTGSTMLGTAKANKEGVAVVSVAQLSTYNEEVYVTVTKNGKLESARQLKTYDPEKESGGPEEDDITVNNNAGIKDTVIVKGLTEGDIVRVYAAPTGASLLGTATVAKGQNQVEVSVGELGAAEGSVYVSVISKGLLESGRREKEYDSEKQSDGLAETDIVVNNNAAMKDTVTVNNLAEGDVIKVYREPTGSALWGTATAGKNQESAVVSIGQLDPAGGTVYVSVIRKGKLESNRREKTYGAEAAAEELDGDDVDIVNRAGMPDTVTVQGLQQGETVKVYENDATYADLLGTAKAGKDGVAVVSIPQLGTDEGSVYVSVIRNGRLESARIEVEYSAESPADKLKEDDVSIVNLAGEPDTVTVHGLQQGETVKVYRDGIETTPLGTAKAGKDGVAVVSIPQLGTGAGSVYVSVIRNGRLESARIEAGYSPEDVSGELDEEDNHIVIANLAGEPDTVTVDGLQQGDIVKVYRDDTAVTPLGTAVANKSGVAVVSIPQLGTDEGSAYVSVARKGEQESARISVAYSAEGVSGELAAENIEKIANNVGKQDEVVVKGLEPGDTIRVYPDDDAAEAIGTATVAARASRAVVSIAQLGVDPGSVYISVARKGQKESPRIPVAYLGEPQSAQPVQGQITVNNNVGKKDEVTVGDLTSGDIVKVYRDNSETAALLGTATATGKGTATVSIAQLGPEAGSVYVSVTKKGERESGRQEKSYEAEGQSSPPAAVDIRNNVGIKDTVTVKGLEPGDMVKVYASETGAAILGTATAGAGKTEAVVSIAQLGVPAGEVYVSVMKNGKMESERLRVGYLAESQSAQPDPDKILIINNPGTDVVIVYGLEAGDTVKLYGSETGGAVLAKGTVAAGQTQAILTVKQLGADGGTVYISRTGVGQSESATKPKTFEAEE